MAVYIIWDKQAPETLSAAVVNTAATLAAATFVGVFDMFFTIAQLRRNEEDRRQWQDNLERIVADFRAEREQYQAREEQRQAREEQRQALLVENQQQTNVLFARMIELLERRNGGGNGASETPNAG